MRTEIKDGAIKNIKPQKMKGCHNYHKEQREDCQCSYTNEDGKLVLPAFPKCDECTQVTDKELRRTNCEDAFEGEAIICGPKEIDGKPNTGSYDDCDSNDEVWGGAAHTDIRRALCRLYKHRGRHSRHVINDEENNELRVQVFGSPDYCKCFLGAETLEETAMSEDANIVRKQILEEIKTLTELKANLMALLPEILPEILRDLKGRRVIR